MNICKQRRLKRKPRSDNERNELATYIDIFVWPSFLKYGIGAMQAMRDLATSKGFAIFEIDSDYRNLNTIVNDILQQIDILHAIRSK